MRIDRLKLPDFWKKGFEIDFDESEPTTVILGQNGSGKSTLIETIVTIFRDLEDKKISEFPFEIVYICHGHQIEIRCDPKGRKQHFIVDGKTLSRNDFEAIHHEVLPKHVFAYYSGWNPRLERIFDAPTRKLYNQWLNNEDREIPLRRLFYCRKDYSQLVLLAFFLSNNSSATNLLRNYLRIEALDSAIFVLKKPYWRENKKPTAFERKNGDERFWFARGAFKHFLDRLWQCSFAPILWEETVERDVRKPPQKTERLYLYIKNLKQLQALSGNDEPKAFFGLLESLFLSDLLDEVRVTIQRTEAERLSFEQLSEGEQQLLTVLGLILFTQQDESLFLLDEPDTHLNPSWIYQYYNLLEENFPKNASQMLIATHNPLMIGSLYRNQVRLLMSEQDKQGIHQIVGSEPEEDPFGMGVDGLLTSELYGLQSVLPPEILKKIDRRNQLFALDERTPEQDVKLRNLSDELAEVGILRSYLDPYEREFVKAMARLQERKQEAMTPEEVRERNERADEILEQVFDQLEE